MLNLSSCSRHRIDFLCSTFSLSLLGPNVALFWCDFCLACPNLATVHFYPASTARSRVARVVYLYPSSLGNNTDSLICDRLDLLAIDCDLAGHRSPRKTSIFRWPYILVGKCTFKCFPEEIQ